MTSVPTLADVVAEHRWYVPSRRDKPWITRCVGCNWKGDTRNTGKTCIDLHAAHVEQVWYQARTIHTLREIAELPVRSVVRFNGLTTSELTKLDDWGEEWITDGDECTPDANDLPALLIWHPDWDNPILEDLHGNRSAKPISQADRRS
ncbi:hypothetical protein A5742_25655 [Mycolicibacterium fortuitum]|uniref:Uncharacterized protein n=1 Tax=Mycolicibacterium fortuitum TaxID=1766 RepID=A0ABD6QMS0_MYCFO|nr:hypothetical protein [Mycolicibacterium fortuitum]OMC46165.1 hypothetical protein A5742_25655 [Mycolicibacterium fortuitum]